MLFKSDLYTILDDYDVIIAPTAPVPAFKIGEKIADPATMYASDMLTTPVNLAGIPAISDPCGFSNAGLPIGLQIIGKHFDEKNVLRAAHAYEQATDHHTKRPNLGGEA